MICAYLDNLILNKCISDFHKTKISLVSVIKRPLSVCWLFAILVDLVTFQFRSRQDWPFNSVKIFTSCGIVAVGLVSAYAEISCQINYEVLTLYIGIKLPCVYY
jgi:hypothetical protein